MVFIIVWIVVREYTALNFSSLPEKEQGKDTLVLVSVDGVVYIFRVLKVMSHHREIGS